MHIVAHHALHDIPALCKFISTNPLGLVTTAIKHPTLSTLQSSHVPWVIDVSPDGAKLPILRGHLARANPQSTAIMHELQERPRPWPTPESTSHRLDDEVLVIFNGPSEHYISPKFYVQTKPSTGKVVPTWDYTAVQAYGRATVYIDRKAQETTSFLEKQLRDLSKHCEENIMQFETPWEVDEAPKSYTDMLSKAIIGIEIEVTKLEGRLKLSQDKPLGDRDGIVAGLRLHGTPNATFMAEEVQRQSVMKAAQAAS